MQQTCKGRGRREGEGEGSSKQGNPMRDSVALHETGKGRAKEEHLEACRSSWREAVFESACEGIQHDPLASRF